MENKVNRLENTTILCLVQVKGDTVEIALDQAFRQLRMECSKQVSGSIIAMNAVEVKVLEEKKHVKTEKFLYFLFPRERASYELRLEVTVDVKHLRFEFN